MIYERDGCEQQSFRLDDSDVQTYGAYGVSWFLLIGMHDTDEDDNRSGAFV
jgi:hypothetical protein